MQNLIVPQPYEFVPPRFNPLIYGTLKPLLPLLLRKAYGVTSISYSGQEKLRQSLQAGHGILLAPNHSRPADPFVIAELGNACRRPVNIMSTWHIFMENRLQRYMLQRVGIFSVHRESVDRKALRCAEDILVAARHPLVMFPEAIVSRTNDHMNAFLRGSALVSRRAALRRRAVNDGQVVIHPIFIRYTFGGDVEARTSPVLAEVETRLGWQPQKHVPLRERILKSGQALLASKEIEYLGSAGSGPLSERVRQLKEVVLQPVERKWISKIRHPDTMARVKAVRMRIFPRLLENSLAQAERDELWRDIADLYFVQQLHCYPENYLATPDNERLLEIVEHYEEDLTDKVRPHFPLHAEVHVGDALPVPAERNIYPHGDPLMASLRARMEGLMAASRKARVAPEEKPNA
jgi:1-acyl-sn-glycerol-3-phosphate acyltransferase